MGITIEQWRCAIGTYCPKYKQSDSWKQVDLNDPISETELLIKAKGPWKLHALLLMSLLCCMLAPNIIPCLIPSGLLDVTSTEATLYSNPNSISLESTLPRLGMTLSHSCRRALLLISGVESNPGPTHLEILADLCAKAPSNEIRDCIRTYKDDLPHVAQHSHIKQKNRRATLESTLTYLQCNVNLKDYTVEGLVDLMIFRIQNFLPETCQHCSEEYCFKLGETPLLCCKICGQGSHTPCTLDALKIPAAERDDFTPELAVAIINPMSLPELHYLCQGCVNEYLPDKTEGLVKRIRAQRQPTRSTSQHDDNLPLNQANATQPAGNADHQDDTGDDAGPLADNNDAADTRPHDDDTATRTNSGAAATRHAGTDGNTDPQQSQSNNDPNSLDVCFFYKKGTCRYGIAGRGCPKYHPKACKKLLQFGTRGPRGCTAGTRCEKFHPIMCQSSLRKLECYNQECKLVHISRTRRTRPRDSIPRSHDMNNNDYNDAQNSNHNNTQAHNQRSNYGYQNQQNALQSNTQQQYYPEPQTNMQMNSNSRLQPTITTQSFLEEALQAMRREMRQEIHNCLPAAPQHTDIQQTLTTFKQEMMDVLNNRLTQHQPSPPSFSQVLQHGGQGNGVVPLMNAAYAGGMQQGQGYHLNQMMPQMS